MHKLIPALLCALACCATAADEVPLDRPGFFDVPPPEVRAAPSGADDAPQSLIEVEPLLPTVAPPPMPAAPPPVAQPLASKPPPLPPPIKGIYAYAREGAQLRATPSPRGRSLASLPSGAVIKRGATLQTSTERWWQGETEGYGSGWISEREMVGE